MVSAKDETHPDNTARSNYYHPSPHNPSHPSQYAESTMYPVSSKYSHRPQEFFPQKMPYDNMKQLLSKPAVIPSSAGPSESGGYSLRAAQREGMTGSPAQLRRRIASEDTHSRSEGFSKSVGTRSASDTDGTHRSNWVAPWELEHAGSSTELLPPPKRGGLFSRSPSMTRKYVSDSENVSSGRRKEEEKKFRTVLRRPSFNRPTSPTSLDVRPPILSSGLVSSPTSLLSPTSANAVASRSISQSQASTIRPTKGKSRFTTSSPSSSQDSSRNSSRDRASWLDKGKPGHMTPAEEVMLSYKSQMERERSIEQSFEEAERNVAEARRLSDDRRAAVKASREQELERGREQMRMMQGASSTPAETTPPSTPYFTVFGSTSGRVVAASDDDGYHEQDQSSENFRNLRPAAGGFSQVTHSKETQNQTVSVSIGTTKPSKDSHGFGKALSRKLSLKWNGLRSSKHENHTPTSSMTGMASIDPEFGGNLMSDEKRLSIAGRRATSPSSGKKGPYPGLRLSIEKSYTTRSRVPSYRQGGDSVDVSPKPHSAPSLGLSSATTSSPLGGRSSESKSSFRSLMRRLSTGALRDQQRNRSQDVAPDSCPPPVPALPQSVVSMMKAGAAVNSAETSASGSPLHRTRTRRSYSDNTGARRPQTSTGVPQTAPPKSSSSSTTTSNRPSTATRSSSPERYSSPRSARSSTSSYGKEIPPLPTFSNLKLETPRYILSPAELAASQQHVNSPVMSDTEKALPLPPSQRRRKTSQTQNSNFVSPMIPEFSTASPINVFPKKSHTGRPATSPSAPPLPTRSSNRPTTTAFPPSSPVSYTPPFPINSRYAKNDDGRDMSAMKDDTLPPNRKSTSSIKKPVNTSSPWEATVGRTSDEEVWEGLLRKSAQAGGTLHIRSTDTEQLESDNLRFSVADI